ncbi:hypothetical protein B7463_g3538, partial [Scytalidium lignicola]
MEPIDFQYSGVRHLLQCITNIQDDAVAVKGVTPEQFTQLRSEFEEKGRKFRLSLFLADIKLVIITIPTPYHEAMHARLGHRIYAKAIVMRLKNEFIPVAVSTYDQRDAAGNITSSGESDSSYKPEPLRPTVHHYPTLIIQSGYTQSWNSLRTKGRWWFEVSKHDVKIVLLVRLDEVRQEITIERWKEVQHAPQQLGQQISAHTAVEPRCVQNITISRAPRIGFNNPNRFNPTSYQVVNAPLRLDFIDLMLRPPIAPEADIILGVADLQEFAAGVWRNYP